MFDPDEKSKILLDEHLTKKTVETLLNEIFTKDKNENEGRISEFAKEHHISVDQVAGRGPLRVFCKIISIVIYVVLYFLGCITCIIKQIQLV